MWKKITSKEIKSIPLGSKMKVGGVETTLEKHYPQDDSGFNTRDEIKKGSFLSNIFSHSDWLRYPDSVFVWVEKPVIKIPGDLESLRIFRKILSCNDIKSLQAALTASLLTDIPEDVVISFIEGE